MLRVDTALFSNVVTAVQRTGNLPGGAVRGLPNGVSIEGLKGVDSFAAAVADAKREFELGRIHNAAQQVRQLETNFNSIAGRWNATVTTIVSSARQGRNQLPLQKLNEVKNAQSKMRQVTSPATKAFRDLITALEHVIANGGDSDVGSDGDGGEPKAGSQDEANDHSAATETATDEATAKVTEQATELSARSTKSSGQPTLPTGLSLEMLGKFADKYQYGPRLAMRTSDSGKRYLSPKLEEGKFYFFKGLDPPGVIRVREIQTQAILVFDALSAQETRMSAAQLQVLLGDGIWLLVPGK